jgi:hypothetical protein
MKKSGSDDLKNARIGCELRGARAKVIFQTRHDLGGRNDVLRATLAFDKRAIVPDGLPRLRDVLGSDLILVPRSESSPTERRAISATAARRPERRAQSPTGEC